MGNGKSRTTAVLIFRYSAALLAAGLINDDSAPPNLLERRLSLSFGIPKPLLPNQDQTAPSPEPQPDAIQWLQARRGQMCMDWRAIETIVGPQTVHGDSAPHDGQTCSLMARNSAASIVQLNDINQHAVNLYSLAALVSFPLPSPEHSLNNFT